MRSFRFARTALAWLTGSAPHALFVALLCFAGSAAVFSLIDSTPGSASPLPKRVALVPDAARARTYLAPVSSVVARPAAAPSSRAFITVRGDAALPSYPGKPMPGTLGAPPVLVVPASILEENADPNQIDGIDYSDPVARGAVPLVKVAGRWNDRLSRGFRVRDFASRDGASYARISDRLVDSMEKLRTLTGSLGILSGYRHQAYNERIEGSAAGSQHIAGLAADVWSAAKTPLELADLALETLGCGIGLGLGANSLHIDLRGYLASWTYPGAALSEQAFDARVRSRCGLPPVEDVEVDSLAAGEPSGPGEATDATSNATTPAPDSAMAPPVPAPLEPAEPTPGGPSGAPSHQRPPVRLNPRV